MVIYSVHLDGGERLSEREPNHQNQETERRAEKAQRSVSTGTRFLAELPARHKQTLPAGLFDGILYLHSPDRIGPNQVRAYPCGRAESVCPRLHQQEPQGRHGRFE